MDNFCADCYAGTGCVTHARPSSGSGGAPKPDGLAAELIRHEIGLHAEAIREEVKSALMVAKDPMELLAELVEDAEATWYLLPGPNVHLSPRSSATVSVRTQVRCKVRGLAIPPNHYNLSVKDYRIGPWHMFAAMPSDDVPMERFADGLAKLKGGKVVEIGMDISLVVTNKRDFGEDFQIAFAVREERRRPLYGEDSLGKLESLARGGRIG